MKFNLGQTIFFMKNGVCVQAPVIARCVVESTPEGIVTKFFVPWPIGEHYATIQGVIDGNEAYASVAALETALHFPRPGAVFRRREDRRAHDPSLSGNDRRCHQRRCTQVNHDVPALERQLVHLGTANGKLGLFTDNHTLVVELTVAEYSSATRDIEFAKHIAIQRGYVLEII